MRGLRPTTEHSLSPLAEEDSVGPQGQPSSLVEFHSFDELVLELRLLGAQAANLGFEVGQSLFEFS